MTSRIVALAATLSVSLAAASTALAIIPAQQAVVISNVAVAEGNVGLTMFKTQVSLIYTQGPLEVDIVATPGTATADDFSFTPVHLTLVPGTPQEVTGFIIGDRVFETDENFVLTATNPAMGYLGTPGTVIIVDDDLDVAPRVFVDGATVPEGSAGWHSIGARVRLEPATLAGVDIEYRTIGGVPYAVPGALWGDYRATSGMLTFAPGETSKAIPIDVNGDTAWEPDASFSVELVGARGALLGAEKAEIVLANDDAPTVVTIEDLETTEGQAGKRAVSVRVRFDPPAPPLAKVHVDLVGGSARAGEDFVGGSQDLYPAPGSTSMTFELDVLSDTTPECDEGVLIEYQGINTGDDTPKVAKLLIRDDDGGSTDGGGACADPFLARTVPVEADGGATTGAEPGADGGAGEVSAKIPASPLHRGCALAPGAASSTSLLTVLALVGAVLASRRRR
jgi:hypothetical protein